MLGVVGKISSLEMQLSQAQREADSIHDELSEEMSVLKRRSRDRSDRERQELQDQTVRLTKQLEMLKAEVGRNTVWLPKLYWTCM